MNAGPPRTEPRARASRGRVALILHKFSRGGSDRVAAHLARGFTDVGFAVELVVFCQGGEVEGVLAEVLGPDIPVRYLGRTTGWRPLDLILGTPAAVRALQAFRPDAVISTANNTAWISALVLALSGLRQGRLILKTTNPIARSRHRGLVKRLRLWGYRQVFKRTRKVWTLSAQESQEMRAEFPAFPDLFEDVTNPYVTEGMLAEPLQPPPAGGPRTVISIARLTAQKRLDRLIAAFALVSDPTARLKILGEGQDRAALTAQIAELGLADRVAMPGYVADVARELHQAHVFALTSDYEGLPAAVLEAMAANCAVLSTDCFPAARAMLADRPGCSLIEDPEPAAIAKLIDRHLAQPRPEHLRQFAQGYSVANGVGNHISALSALV